MNYEDNKDTIVAILIAAVIGLGIYAFSEHSQVEQLNQSVGNAQSAADDASQAASDANDQAQQAQDQADQTQSQVDDLQSQVDDSGN